MSVECLALSVWYLVRSVQCLLFGAPVTDLVNQRPSHPNHYFILHLALTRVDGLHLASFRQGNNETPMTGSTAQTTVERIRETLNYFGCFCTDNGSSKPRPETCLVVCKVPGRRAFRFFCRRVGACIWFRGVGATGVPRSQETAPS